MLRAAFIAALLVTVVLPAVDARWGGECGVYSPGIRLPADLYCMDEEGWCAFWERTSDACLGAGVVPPWPLA